ncbi:MAG: DNA methyltransferase [Methanophagales archaeon]|nr:DNA methyltransferase [Methanophagales archaeon]
MPFNTKQTPLFEGRNSSPKYDFLNAVEMLPKIDWNFKDFNTQYLSHTFHSYPARFIPQIPLTFIKLFTEERETILDPFCGCGTTLVEAFLNNRNSVGNDFNPLAALITKVKTTLIDDAQFRYFNRKLAVLKRYLVLDSDSWRVNERTNNLPNRKVSAVFSRKVISKLEAIREALLEVKEEGQEDLFDFGRVALSSTVWSLVENGGGRGGGRGSGIEVDDLFLRKVKFMEKEVSKMATLVPGPEVRVICGDARKLNLQSGSVDLIVTSPPYVNALDYYRIHMYNMLWLGMDFDLFRKHEIGGHSHFISNRFRLLSEYLGDMLRSMIEMNRVLKKGKLCVIVVGNSSVEYELIESHKFFAEMGEKMGIGFTPLKTIFRKIDKTRKYTSADVGKIDDEYVVVMRKVKDSEVAAGDDDFISEVVSGQMTRFREQIKKVQGTSIRGRSGRKPTKERLLKNIDKITAAIETIPEDIKIK